MRLEQSCLKQKMINTVLPCLFTSLSLFGSTVTFELKIAGKAAFLKSFDEKRNVKEKECNNQLAKVCHVIFVSPPNFKKKIQIYIQMNILITLFSEMRLVENIIKNTSTLLSLRDPNLVFIIHLKPFFNYFQKTQHSINYNKLSTLSMGSFHFHFAVTGNIQITAIQITEQ